MTFAELIAETFRRIGEDQSAEVYWNTQDVKDSLNEGYLDFCEQTRCFTRECEIQAVDKLGLSDLRALLPYPFLGLRRIYGVTFNRPLESTTVKARDDNDTRWQMVTGVVRRWFVSGLYFLGLWPAPDAAELFRIVFTSLPDKLENDLDEPQIPVQFHEALLHYAVYDLKIQEDEMKNAMSAWQDYITSVALGQKYVANQIRAPRTWVMGDAGRKGLALSGWYE